jgi:two-component system response regulator (stage 0 sporulation protein A)
MHKTTASNVERGIRHAIETVWNNQDPEILISLYGNSVNPNKTRPTNSEFIANIAHRLLIENRENVI